MASSILDGLREVNPTMYNSWGNDLKNTIPVSGQQPQGTLGADQAPTYSYGSDYQKNYESVISPLVKQMNQQGMFVGTQSQIQEQKKGLLENIGEMIGTIYNSASNFMTDVAVPAAGEVGVANPQGQFGGLGVGYKLKKEQEAKLQENKAAIDLKKLDNQLTTDRELNKKQLDILSSTDYEDTSKDRYLMAYANALQGGASKLNAMQVASNELVAYRKPEKATNITINGQKAETNLRKEFNMLPETKRFRDIQGSYNKIQSTTPNTPQGQMSLIFAYMKMLDPISVVREGEYATAKNAASVPDVVRNMYNKAKDGTFLNQEQINRFKSEAENLYNTELGLYNNRAREYQSYASDSGADPTKVAPTYQKVEREVLPQLVPGTKTPGTYTDSAGNKFRVFKDGSMKSLADNEVYVWNSKKKEYVLYKGKK